MVHWRVWKKRTGCVKKPQKMGSLKGNSVSDTTSSPNTGCFLHFSRSKVKTACHIMTRLDENDTCTYICSHSLFLCAPHLFMNTGSKLNSEPNSESHYMRGSLIHFQYSGFHLTVASSQRCTCRSPRGRTTQHAWVNWRSLHDSLWQQTSLTASLMSFCVWGRWAITEQQRSANSHGNLEKSTDPSKNLKDFKFNLKKFKLSSSAPETIIY